MKWKEDLNEHIEQLVSLIKETKSRDTLRQVKGRIRKLHKEGKIDYEKAKELSTLVGGNLYRYRVASDLWRNVDLNKFGLH